MAIATLEECFDKSDWGKIKGLKKEKRQLSKELKGLRQGRRQRLSGGTAKAGNHR